MSGNVIGSGEFGIIDITYDIVWHNAVSEALHAAVIAIDNREPGDLYGACRMDSVTA